MIIIVIIGIIIWIVCLVANIRIAQRKNRKHLALWVVLSIFFTLITLIINAIIPKRKDCDYDR